MRADVAVVGGGSAAGVAAAVLLQSAPKTRTLIVELRESTPDRRETILLQPGVDMLREIGLWDCVVAGAGKTERPFEFAWTEASRVDSAVLEAIVLDRAAASGAEVIRGVALDGVSRAGGRIERVTLADGRVIEADWYIDGGGRPTPTAVAGENWLAFADTSALADPILPVGPTLDCVMGRAAGCTLAAIAREGADRRWLMDQYAAAWADQLGVHARLSGACQELRTPAPRADALDRAWASLAAGGFAPIDPYRPMVGVLSIAETIALLGGLVSSRQRASYAIEAVNVIKPNLLGAKQDVMADFRDGGVRRLPCLRRDGQTLPLVGVFERLLDLLKQHTIVGDLLDAIRQQASDRDAPSASEANRAVVKAIEGLESMLRGGWLIGRMDKRRSLGDWSASLDLRAGAGGPRDRTRNAPEATVRPAIP